MEWLLTQTLDVGCGVRMQGTVNLDLRVKLINVNSIRADGCYLPFKNNVFLRAVCYHVIEHVPQPFLLLRELIRVTKGLVTVTCPWRFTRMAKKPYHHNYFSKGWFTKKLAGIPDINFEIQIVLCQRSIFQIPLEIKVDIWKKGR